MRPNCSTMYVALSWVEHSSRKSALDLMPLEWWSIINPNTAENYIQKSSYGIYNFDENCSQVLK